MKTPQRLAPLLEDGLIDDVVRQLMSGKEATVYVVRCGAAGCCTPLAAACHVLTVLLQSAVARGGRASSAGL